MRARRQAAGLACILLIATFAGCGSHAPLPRVAVSPAADRGTDPPGPIPLDAEWYYRSDGGNIGLARGWPALAPQGRVWRSLQLPDDFNPRVRAASDGGTVGWYATTFTGPPAAAGRSWAVAFESVRRHAGVWLNGVYLGGSGDPYAPFTVPARSLKPAAPNLLVVRVDNIKGPDSLPEDWWNWGGITGPVQLVPVGRASLAELGVMPRLSCQLRCAQLHIEGRLTSQWPRSLSPQLAVTVTAPGGGSRTVRRALPALPPRRTRDLSIPIPVAGRPQLWSPEHPALYTVRVELWADGRLEQRQQLRVGLRTVAVRRGQLYLNGRRLWLHGAAIHEDVLDRGAALSDGDIDTIVSQLRSLGVNITRAHYLLSPRLLDALDAAGILVWAQPPVDHADLALRSAAGRRRALAFLRSTVIGDRSHPSVIVNSVGNELTPAPDSEPGTRNYLRQAVALSRRLAPGVPVALDTYCYPGFPPQRSYRMLDVLGISSYFGWYRGIPGHGIGRFSGLKPFLRRTHARYPRQALVVSEFGAEALFPGPVWLKGTYAFQTAYLRRTLAVLDHLPFMNGSIYWTLREFAVVPGWRGGAWLPSGDPPDGVHHKGLLAYDDTPKPAFTMAQSLFAQVPAFVSGGSRRRAAGRSRPESRSGQRAGGRSSSRRSRAGRSSSRAARRAQRTRARRSARATARPRGSSRGHR